MSYLYRNKKNIMLISNLAIPVIVENILQTFLGTVDTYFAGCISDNAIASIGVTNLIINLFIVIFGDITHYEETFFVIGASGKNSVFVSLYNDCMHFILLRYLLSDFGKSNAAIDRRQRNQ